MLLADGGSGGVTPVTTFTPLTFNPPFNPARTTSSNDADAAALAQQRAAAIAAAQRAALAAQRAAEAAARAAAEARAKALAAKEAADKAQAAAAADKATQAQKDHARTLDAQARSAEADAEKKEADAELAKKDQALKDAQLADANRHRAVDDPSAATRAAQADYDAAAKVDKLVNHSGGDSSALADAQARTKAAQATAVASDKAVAKAKANGGKPTADQLAQASKDQDDWIAAMKDQMRVAATAATADGKDPDAAIDKQMTQIVGSVKDNGYFDVDSVKGVLTASAKKGVPTIVEQLKSETPAQRALMLEMNSALEAGRPQVAAAQSGYDQASAAAKAAQKNADAAIAAASQHTTYGPYVSTTSAASAKNAALAAPTGPGGLSANALQAKAAQLQDAADAAKARLDALEQVYGHTDATHPENDTIGLVQADYQKRGADLAVADTRAAYMKALGDPSSTPAQRQSASSAWQHAVDAQTLAGRTLDAIQADARLQDSKAALAAAQKAHDDPKMAAKPAANQFSALTLSPTFLAGTKGPDYANPADRARVKLVDGHYVTVGADGLQHALSPTDDALWSAHVQVDADTQASGKANAAWQQAVADKGTDKVPGLDIDGQLKKANDYANTLGDANTKVAQAKQNLQTAIDGGRTPAFVQQCRVDLGAAMQAQELAQAQVDKVHAMQALRDTQLWGSDASGQAPDVTSQLDAVRKASQKVDQLQAAALSPDAEKALRQQALPQAKATRDKVDKELESNRPPPGEKPDAAYRALLQQRDFLTHKIDAVQSQLDLVDAQRAALAAPIEYAQASRPTAGVDLKSRDHSAANDAALTWDIKPDKDGKAVTIAGLPSNIQASDVKVTKDGNDWYVTFDKSSGAYAMRVTAAGRAGSSTSYVDGSHAGDIAIEKGHRYKMDAATARLWEATSTNKDFGSSTLVTAMANAKAASAQVQVDGPTDGAGKPLAAAAAPAVVPPGGTKAISPITFNDDQGANLAAANTNFETTKTALANANAAQAAGGGDPAVLKANVDTAQANFDLAKSQQAAIQAVVTWQEDNYARQEFDMDARAGRLATVCYTKPLDQVAREQRATATSALDALQTTKNRIGLAQADADVKSAQGTYDQWRASHPYMLGSAKDSQAWQDLQAATARRDAAKRDLTAGAVPAAVDAKNALIANNIPPGQQSDPQALYDLFNAHPDVMAQDIVNAHYAQMGGMPSQMHNRTEIANSVALSMGYAQTTPFQPGDIDGNLQLMQTRNLFSGLPKAQQDGLDKVVDQIVDTGGDTATVTALPVVYATKQDGLQSTTLFKVESGGDKHFVDEYGERYSSVDDYRANNNLPVDGVTLAMPKDGDFKLDSNGNVQLYTGDARTETGWQHFRRQYHVDTVVGVLAVAGGVALEFGSGGLLTPIAGALVVGGLTYGVGTGVQDLVNRSQHGLDINPLTSREAGMDWLNIGASMLAVPELGAAGRAGALALRTTGTAGRAVTELSTGARTFVNVSSKAAKYTGYAAMADGGEYMAQNWSQMSDSDKSEQGGMFLLNLLSTRAHPMAEGIKSRQAVANPVHDTPVTTLAAPARGTRPGIEDVAFTPSGDTADAAHPARPLSTNGTAGTPPVASLPDTPVVNLDAPVHAAPTDVPAVAPVASASPSLGDPTDGLHLAADTSLPRTASRSFTTLDDAPVESRTAKEGAALDDESAAQASAHHDAQAALYDRLSPAAAALVDKSPTLKGLIASASRDGVTVRVGAQDERGGASFTEHGADGTTVVVGLQEARDPATLVDVLAHELSHARVGRDMPLGIDAAGARAPGAWSMANEGEARLVQLVVRDEVLRAGGPDLMPDVTPRELEIYAQAGRTLDLAKAAQELDGVMRDMRPSTAPGMTYAQLHGADAPAAMAAPQGGDRAARPGAGSAGRTAPESVNDIHAHHGGANAGAYMRNPIGDVPSLTKLFELTRGKVLIQRVPQTAEPYYLVRDADGVYETSMTVHPDGRVSLDGDILFKDNAAPRIPKGTYTRDQLERAGLDFREQWPAGPLATPRRLAFNIEPGLEIGYRGMQRDVGLIDQVGTQLDPDARQRAYVGLTASDPAASDNVESLLAVMNYANHADPDGSWLKIPGLGETTLVKEGVTPHLNPKPDLLNPAPIDRLASKIGEMGGMMVVHSDSGTTRVIGAPQAHGLLVHGPSDYANVEPLLAFFRRHPDVKFVWAHAGGLGRTVQPGPRHIELMDAALADPSLKHVSVDLSWDVVSKYIGDPAMKKQWAALVNKYPDRFIYGSDSVAAATPDIYDATIDVYRDTGFLDLLHDRGPLLRGNFDRLVETTSNNVRQWRLQNKELLAHYPLTEDLDPPHWGGGDVLPFPARQAAPGATPPGAQTVKGSQWPELLAEMKSGRLSADGDVYVYRVQAGPSRAADSPVTLEAGSRQLQGWMHLPQGSTKPRWLGQSEPGSVAGIPADGHRRLGAMGSAPWSDDFQLVVTRTPPQALRDGGPIDAQPLAGNDLGALSLPSPGSTPATIATPPVATPATTIATTSPAANGAGKGKIAAIYGSALGSATATAAAAYGVSFNPEWTLDPNVTGPVSFIYRGTVNSLRGRLAQRIDFHAREAAGTDPGAHLDWLQRAMVNKGALLGLKPEDRASIADAIATLRQDGGDADALQVLDGASRKLLSPGTPAGAANSLLQWGTLGVNNANSAMWFHTHGFDPSNPTTWSTAAFLGANLGLSAINNASTFGIWSRVGALKDRMTMKVSQTLVMSGYASGSLPLALTDALAATNGVGYGKTALDLAFGSGAAWAAARDVRGALSRGPARDPRSYKVAPGIILGAGVAARMALQLMFPPPSGKQPDGRTPATPATPTPTGSPSPLLTPGPVATTSPGAPTSVPGTPPTPRVRVHAT